MKSQSQVLEEACSVELIQLRLRIDLHLISSHNTEDCTTLKDKIENLIQKGHLPKFFKDPLHD